MYATERTDTLLRALRQAERLDLAALAASGVDVTLSRFGDPERLHVERVTVAAEDAAPIRDAIVAALRKSLQRRREALKFDIAEIDVAIGASA